MSKRRKTPRGKKRTLRQILAAEVSVPIELAGTALGVGRSSAYAAAGTDELPVVKVGKRMSVPTAWLRKKLQIEA